MSTDVVVDFTNAPHTQTQLASAACPSGEGHDGPVIPKEGIQAIPICSSGKDDAQTLSTSSADKEAGFLNDSTFLMNDPLFRECFHNLVDEYIEKKREARLKNLESGAESEKNPTRQTPIAVVSPNDNSPVPKDEETTRIPSRSNPTTVDWLCRKRHTAWIVLCAVFRTFLIICLFQAVYVLYTNLWNSRFWGYAVRDWCFASNSCRTRVGDLLEFVDVVFVAISAVCGTVQMMWLRAADVITPWMPLMHWAGHVFLVGYISWSTSSGSQLTLRHCFSKNPLLENAADPVRYYPTKPSSNAVLLA